MVVDAVVDISRNMMVFDTRWYIGHLTLSIREFTIRQLFGSSRLCPSYK